MCKNVLGIENDCDENVTNKAGDYQKRTGTAHPDARIPT